MNIHDTFREQEYKCFIFSDDVDQIETLLASSNKNSNVPCKIINLKTELRFLRRDLQNNYNVDISRIDILDNNKVFILTRNFKKIEKIPVSKLPEDIEVVENLKNDLFIIAMSTITRLSIELPNMQNKKNAKFRNKTKQLNMLKQTISKDLMKIM